MRVWLLIAIILAMSSVQAAKMTVGPFDEDYQTIQKAIDHASWGDTIEVHSGGYLENIRVTKAVTLMGVDTGNGLPVVNASGSGSVITLLANRTVLKGFNLTGSGGCGCGNAGIAVKSSNSIISENILYKNKYGIYVEPGSSVNVFSSNDFLDNEISSRDQGGNNWSASMTLIGLKSFIKSERRLKIEANHFSDYDEPGEGCNDLNEDYLCDQPKNLSIPIESSKSIPVDWSQTY